MPSTDGLLLRHHLLTHHERNPSDVRFEDHASLFANFVFFLQVVVHLGEYLLAIIEGEVTAAYDLLEELSPTVDAQAFQLRHSLAMLARKLAREPLRELAS